MGRWVVLIPFAVLLLGIGAAAGFEVAGARTPAYVAEYAPLGSWIARPVQAVTDFDGDGFSGLMGGGDCAPLDETIAPGKLDVPGDGIDNNCVGGDATKTDGSTKPQWFDLPDDWPKYDLLLVTVETLRADHVGFNGYGRDTTPHLDELAKTSAVFEHFYATSTFTRLALPSLLAGRTPSRIDWEKQARTKFPRLADSNPWLPAALQQAGFRTGAIMANFPAFTDADSIGFDRGFDDFDPKSKLVYKGGTMRGFPSKSQVKKTKTWLKARKPDERFMLWVHFFEPHYLYQQFPKAPKFGKGRKAKYDSEIWGVDQAIGQIVQHLKEAGRFDRTIIAVMGDHGEEFEEHGQKYHGSNLYDPQTRTPLLLHVPGRSRMRLPTPASFVDVVPTLLNLLDVQPSFDEFEGRNLTPRLFGKTVPERPFFLEVWKVKTRAGYKVAVVNWPYKLLASGTTGKNQELYDLSKDPEESENLRKELPDVARSMEEALYGYLDSTRLEYVETPPSTE
jgi:arylsulfatase A-like enzyme